ncbi:nuclear transport factor 2 family protein [Marinibaculum pumilum]|uniref:Nuclear transport factor 2 family protein n=1 Tax=Marinibaculum pumilum TaxID=1766165 RepID=A0ABV7LA33_9PROT
MPLTPAEMDSKMDAHFQFEIRDDVEGVLTTLAPNVEHDIVGAPTGPVRGREAARAFYDGLFADLAEGEVTNLRRYHGENFLVDESLWRGRAVGRPFGMEGGNRQVEFRLLHVLEFTEAGEIARENVWLDFPALMRQLTQG